MNLVRSSNLIIDLSDRCIDLQRDSGDAFGDVLMQPEQAPPI